jgi:hypothetical protein
MKYELLSNDTINVSGHILKRVKYFDVGELGGYIESEENLSQAGNAHVSGDAKISGNACVSGDAEVSGNARVLGDAEVSGNAEIHDALMCGGFWEKSPLQIRGSLYLFNVAGKNQIAVGCHIKTVEEWRDIYKNKFVEYRFTKDEQREYLLYFNLASALYGFGFTLPLPDEEQRQEI